MMSDSARLFLLLLLALGQGALYVAIVPPWQHYDEPTHFEHAWLVAHKELRPEMEDVDATMRREVLASMTRHDFFPDLPPRWLTDAEWVPLGVSELTHPPAYYAYLAAGLKAVSFLDFTTQLYIARALTVLLYVGTVAVIYFLTAELTRPGHTLRWLVPLTAMLIGPFANQMTAVNNDAAAAFSLSLFLWMAVRLVRRGFSWIGLLLMGLTAMLAVLSKNTTALAVALMPHVFVLIWWIRRRWPWHWFWVGAALVGGLFIFLFFEGGDSAFWYRYEHNTIQIEPTLTEAPRGAAYPSAIRVTVDSEDPQRQLLNPLFPDQVEELAGKPVTVGGWVWASEPEAISAPGLLVSNRFSTELVPLTEPITVTTTPTFVHATYTMPEEAAVAYYSLFARTVLHKEARFDLYLQGAFLIEGEFFPGAAIPSLGEPLPESIAERNLLRNGTPTEAWPRLRTWVDSAFNRYLRRSPSYLFSALMDVRRNVPFIVGSVAPYLMNDLFVAYGWGHVRAGAPWWSYAVAALVLVGLVGTALWLRRSVGHQGKTLLPALSVLAAAGLFVWVAALTWPLPYNWARLTLPSARYAFAAIAPTAFFLAAGWWAAWKPQWRPAALAFYLLALTLLNIAGLWRIVEFYA